MAAVSLFWDTNMARRTSTGSEAFWLLVEFNASKFVLLSSFPLIETICPKIRTKSPPKSAETPLPVSYSISHGGGDGLQVFSTVTELPGGGTLGFSGWGCAAGTLEPLTYTRASSAEFCYPILE